MPNLDPCGKLTLTVHDAKHHAFYYTTRPSIPGALEYFLPIASMILNNQTRINVTDQILPTANSIQSKHSYLNPQHFASAQYSALSSFFLANCQLPTANCQLFRFRSALSTSLPLSTQHFASAQHSALSTQHFFHCQLNSSTLSQCRCIKNILNWQFPDSRYCWRS